MSSAVPRPEGDFRPVVTVAGRPAEATVYEHGWQSWSPTGRYPGDGRSPRPIYPKAEITNWRREVPMPDDGFQGEGLVAIQPAPDEPILVISGSNLPHVVPSIRVAADRDGLRVTANGEVDQYLDDDDGGIDGALARWADRLVRRLDLPRPEPVGPMWCSWYCFWDTVTDAQVKGELPLFDERGISVDIVQLDDGYQAGIGDWLDLRPGFGDVAEVAAAIRSTGRRAGIWTAPFLAGKRSRVWHDHPDWFLPGVDAGWGWEQDLAALDLSHPHALEYLTSVFSTLSAHGFSFFKLDFLYAGALDGPRHRPMSSIAAYRTGLETIREAVGPDALLLGCGAPLFPSLGLVNLMRVSPDTAARLHHPSGDESMPSSWNARVTGMAREWQHDRFWVNDPDCLLVAPHVERREEWAEWIERSRGFRASSDSIGQLDEWGLAATRRLLTPSRPRD